MLQQENPAIDEQTQIRWQTQHRNSILSQVRFNNFIANSEFLRSF